MSSKYEEISTSLVSLALEMIDITDKFNKMGTKEIDSMIASALNGSKRINSTMKKILELDSRIIALRQNITKANLQAMISKDSDSDPIEVKPDEPKVELKEEPKVEAKVEAKEEPKEEPKEEKKKVRKTKSDEDIPKKDIKDEPKVEKKAKSKAEPKEEKKDIKDEPKEEKKAKSKVEPKEEKKTKSKAEPKEEKKDIKDEPKDETQSEASEDKEPLHLKRKNIPKHIKTLVWGKYIGNDKPESKCYSCKHERIDIRNFHCGHVIAESKGGSLMLDNLRPICAPCNGSMGTMSMNEFTQQFFGWTV
jgi:hypothetical protein